MFVVGAVWTLVQDFWQMIVHHVVTISLMVMSWTANMIRVGTLVLCVHDAVDYLLEVKPAVNKTWEVGTECQAGPVLRNQMTPLITDSRVILFRNILTPGRNILTPGHSVRFRVRISG